MNVTAEQSSFRDRDGFIFYKDDNVYRAIQPSYQPTWELLSTSDFFTALISDSKLIGYETQAAEAGFPKAYRILKLQKVPFISYPSEWTFSQFKKAALLTLAIQKKALAAGFTLKDASAYNVQFIGNKAVFIDTLSFDIYKEGEPWHAYRQFCQHFLGPLLLWHYGAGEMKSLFIDNIDGIPLKLSAKLLPFRSRLNLLAYTHLHLHSKFEAKHGGEKKVSNTALKISKARSLTLVEHLEQGIKSLKIKKQSTNWTGYYESFSYSQAGYDAKKAFIETHAAAIKGQLCIDLGANTGEFSAMAAQHFKYVVACDSDVEVVAAIQDKKMSNVLALHVNLVSPTPAFGWNSNERKAFTARIQNADLTLALALIHHLCIGNNIPLARLAEFFAGLSKQLIIEFVPRTDVQVTKLLVTKKDIFGDYTVESFRAAFGKYFEVTAHRHIPDSGREIFLLTKNKAHA